MSEFSGFKKKKIQIAKETPFDNSTNGFTAEETQAAIEEINQTFITSVSPGFGFGRSSKVNRGTWLQCETVPSNKAGRHVYVNNAKVITVFVSSENIDTFDIGVYHHTGDETNLTFLGIVSIIASRGGTFSVSWPVPTNTQLALKLELGDARNLVCGLELSGTN